MLVENSIEGVFLKEMRLPYAYLDLTSLSTTPMESINQLIAANTMEGHPVFPIAI